MIELDGLIIGAGPAGSCAALRLRQLGYQVGLVERAAFPRQQIGESLTPGIRNILSLLQADEALAGLPHITGLPSLLRWQRDALVQTTHADTAVVSRADFDARLCQLAQDCGVRLWQPARVLATEGEAGAWRVMIGCDAEAQEVTTRWLFDATGRNGLSPTRLACAPSLMALWCEWAPAQVDPTWAAATRVEALSQAWMWASPLPNGRLRVMVFADPHAVHGDRHALWHGALAESAASRALAQVSPAQPLRMCSATPYLDKAAWRPGLIRLGDAAFALDPLSGSGVEKAMRFSLQAVVAWHTWARAANESGRDLAQQYFSQQLNDTCTRHRAWCASHYGRAWCADSEFWLARSQLPNPATGDSSSAADDSAAAHFTTPTEVQKATDEQLSDAEPQSMHPLPAATARVRLDPASRLTPQLCVVEDQVRLAAAVSHPSLPRAVAFVANQALASHWALLCREQSMAELYRALGQVMQPESALAMVRWLWRSGVLMRAA
jgi:flavin-dependent dehydrogenase